MYRILLVKDDPAIRELIVHSFTKKKRVLLKQTLLSMDRRGWKKPGKTV